MNKNGILKGTLLLTAAGLASRVIGFFYRIFLSRMFGEEGMGIYELMNPVLALTFALCTSGIQSAVSKFVAAQTDQSRESSRLSILLAGLSFSGALSGVCAVFVYTRADFIAAQLLCEPRCAPLLRLAALSFPAACIHCCINGYYYGIKKATVPAVCQLTEQLFRVGSVFLFWHYALRHSVTFSINVAAIGLVIGEFASTLVSIPAAWIHFYRKRKLLAAPHPPIKRLLGSLLSFALPLSGNRVCLHLLGAVESARIPIALQQFGYSPSQALSIYGVFTGMAMTCILFPGALTNSVSVLLMPLVAEADAKKNRAAIRAALLKCVRFCLLFGCFFTVVFLLSGGFLGTTLFHSPLATRFIRTLSFLCPFLYLNTTLFSILNGLGKTGLTFFIQMTAQCLRLAFLFLTVPLWGIQGVLWGMLAGQLWMTAAGFLFLLLQFTREL